MSAVAGASVWCLARRPLNGLRADSREETDFTLCDGQGYVLTTGRAGGPSTTPFILSAYQARCLMRALIFSSLVTLQLACSGSGTGGPGPSPEGNGKQQDGAAPVPQAASRFGEACQCPAGVSTTCSGEATEGAACASGLECFREKGYCTKSCRNRTQASDPDDCGPGWICTAFLRNGDQGVSACVKN